MTIEVVLFIGCEIDVTELKANETRDRIRNGHLS